jgi:hypothetical protein
VRLGIRALTALLDAWSLATRGRPVRGLDHATRWRLLLGWRESRLGFCRDLVRFYEGLAVFGWHCERDAHG